MTTTEGIGLTIELELVCEDVEDRVLLGLVGVEEKDCAGLDCEDEEDRVLLGLVDVEEKDCVDEGMRDLLFETEGGAMDLEFVVRVFVVEDILLVIEVEEDVLGGGVKGYTVVSTIV